MKNKSHENPNVAEISEQYSKAKSNYEKLGVNLVQALELFLNEREIKVLSINHRVKDDLSFVEKIDRKHYAKPFDEIEDICGIRIICYYQSDVEKISEVLRDEFTVIENQDKETLLKADQFGYRSTHFIVKIKKEWNKAPNYRGLENLKAEIQIRTVLMHAWAEIEHKLVYKNENQVPSQFRRKLSRISAKLEESDEQFEELLKDITNYKAEIIEKFENNEYIGVELNLDTLQAFLDKHFTDRGRNTEYTSELLKHLDELGLSLSTFFNLYRRTEKYLPKIEFEIHNHKYIREIPFVIACFVLYLVFERPSLVEFPKRTSVVLEKYREIIAADEAAKNKSLK